MAARGHDRPFGFDAGSFATLPSERTAALARVTAADDLERSAAERAADLGSADVVAVRRSA